MGEAPTEGSPKTGHTRLRLNAARDGDSLNERKPVRTKAPPGESLIPSAILAQSSIDPTLATDRIRIAIYGHPPGAPCRRSNTEDQPVDGHR
jgi:hypothetical protein